VASLLPRHISQRSSLAQAWLNDRCRSLAGEHTSINRAALGSTPNQHHGDGLLMWMGSSQVPEHG
jgi:hypothetical protein